VTASNGKLYAKNGASPKSHTDVRSMSTEAIEKCLAIAEHGVSTSKANGGLYG
jgi:hypothetical protein